MTLWEIKCAILQRITKTHGGERQGYLMCSQKRYSDVCFPGTITMLVTLRFDSWYLILDDVGLSKQKLLYAPLCTIMQAILEAVYRTCRDHSTWKTVPDIHNALTEKTWPCIRTAPLYCQKDLTGTAPAETINYTSALQWLHRESKKGDTVTMDITLSIRDRFAKFLHCCKEQ